MRGRCHRGDDRSRVAFPRPANDPYDRSNGFASDRGRGGPAGRRWLALALLHLPVDLAQFRIVHHEVDEPAVLGSVCARLAQTAWIVRTQWAARCRRSCLFHLTPTSTLEGSAPQAWAGRARTKASGQRCTGPCRTRTTHFCNATVSNRLSVKSTARIGSWLPAMRPRFRRSDAGCATTSI